MRFSIGSNGSLVWVGCAVLVACKTPVQQVPLEAGASTSAAPVDAGVAAVIDAGGRAAVPPDNLLEIVPSKVAVSSTVQNPHDFPEHLLDGKLDTAWNGKTGDLVGGWIRFQVPADAKVSYAEMTAGYARVQGDVDLFTANHRISKLQITHNGKKLGEQALDPNLRGLQRIELGASCGADCGGEFELKVLETTPGSNAKWRELVVSELRVVGTPGKALRSEHQIPRVGVLKYDAYPPSLPPEAVASPLPAAYPDVAALCAAWPARAAVERANSKQWDEMVGITKYGPATCTEEPLGAAFAPDSTYLGLTALRLSDGVRTWSSPVVQTARGFTLVGLRYRADDPTDPGCGSILREQAVDGTVNVQHGWLVMPVAATKTTYVDISEEAMNELGHDGTRLILLRGVLWCKEEPGGLACKRVPEYQIPLGIKTAHAWDPWAKQGWDRITWTGESGYGVDAAGDLRLH